MPVYELQTPDGRTFEVEAPDQQSALAAMQIPLPGEPAPQTEIAPGVTGAAGQGGAEGPQAPNIGIKGDQAPGDRIRPDMNGAFVQGLTLGFGDEALTPVATGIRQGINAVTGQGPTNYGDVSDQISARHDAGLAAAREQEGGAATVAELAGALTSAPLLPAAALFKSGKLLPRVANAATAGATYAGIYGAGSAEGDVGDRVVEGLKNAPLGAAFGGAVPILGRGLMAGKDAVANRLQNAFRPNEAAQRIVGQAAVRDRQAGNMFSAADEAAAATDNLPVMNVDRFGETTRATARQAANLSPEARATLTSAAEDRFTTQNIRAQSIVNRLVGGAADDLGYQESLRITAQRSNKPAYDKAYNSPQAQAMWDDDFAQLLQAPAMQQAVRESTTRGANRAAVDGFRAVKNPFQEVDGVFQLKKNKDGSQALPNLPFWDQVKRNLDSTIGTLQRSGDRAQAADVTALKNGLVDLLDTAVPEFATARQGAARFFDAEDALEAGRKFVTSNQNIRGAVQNIKKMTDPEREAFRTGFAAELMERITKTNDRTNVIRQVFGSPASRAKIEAALGKGAARELETFAKIETTMDQLRTALGNSTTTRQLVELGLGGGIGGATGLVQGGGDPATAALYAIAGAAAGRGFTKAREAVTTKVMREVADILSSADPAKMINAVRQITSSKARQRALDAFMDRVGAIGGASAVSQISGP